MILHALLWAALAAATTPFSPLPQGLTDDAGLRQLLRAGDVVVARTGAQQRPRVFTGLALAERSCDEAYTLLADPRRYPEIYPMVEEVRVVSQRPGEVEYDMRISIGAGSTTQRMRLQRPPGRVLRSTQPAGRSAWRFLPAGEGACLLHFTHDEDLTKESAMIRMALASKRPIVQGIQAAAAVGNVGNVRRFLARSRPRSPVAAPVVDGALARLASVGTAAYLPHRADQLPLVAARTAAAPARALAEAGASERWGEYVELFSGELLPAHGDGARRMRYTLTSAFEDLEFETVQRRAEGSVEERIVGGELSDGGWSWRAHVEGRGTTLLLSMQLDVAQGDWLVKKLAELDPTAREGTWMGVAFMLVERVAARAAARTP
jgi:ribosome-associated toxin RatA of RatAB toxin-antitoxin module